MSTSPAASAVRTDASTLGDDLSSPAVPADSLEAMLAEAVAAPATFLPLAEGTVIGERYTIVQMLGAGGMGTVYLAHDRSLDRKVALKLHRTSSAADRLHREAIAMARLAHPNVVTVFEVGAYDGRAFVAMEYVAGANLRAWLAAAPRSWRQVLAVLREVGTGLAAAHDAGIIHRDVKPDNMFIGDDGRARIGDFGLARLEGDAETSGTVRPITGAIAKNTATGAVMGTPLYMAPEQIAGQPLDARTDQFAFAVAAWEALCGERPFEGKTIDDLHDAIVRASPAAKRQVPARIRRVLMRALAARPEARWPSIRALIQALRSAERRPRVIAAIGGAALLAGAATTWALWPEPDPTKACDDAGAEIDAIIPQATIDAAAAAARGDGPRVARVATELRDRYRNDRRSACVAHATGAWSPRTAAASRDCLDLHARELGALLAVAPELATQPSDVLQIVLAEPSIAECTDELRIGSWRLIGETDAERPAATAARARLAAGAVLVELGQLPAARRIRDDVANSPALHVAPVGENLELLRARIAIAEGKFDDAQKLLESLWGQARILNDASLVLETAREMIGLQTRGKRDRVAATRWMLDGLVEAGRLHTTAPRAAFDLYVAVALAQIDAGDAPNALQTALRAKVLTPPGDDGRAAVLLDVRASALAATGKTDEALDVDQQVIDTMTHYLGPTHPRVADALSVRAALLLDAGHVADAAETAHRALAILEATTETGASIAQAETNIGAALLKMNDPAAEAHLARARAIRVAQLGEEHPDVAHIDTNLALLHLDRGDVAGGLALLRHATVVAERALGPVHEELADALYNLAVAERRSGDTESALASAMRAAGIYGRLKPGSSRHAIALANVAALENQRGLHEEALATAAFAGKMPAAAGDPNTDAWLRLEAGRALLALHRDTARARAFLTRAKVGYALANLPDRVAEVDALLASAGK